jgi:uncharacterized protein involved in exopolysaccharide biosynthesis
MSATGTKPTTAPIEPEILEPGRNGHDAEAQQQFQEAAERQAQTLRIIWDRRRMLFRFITAGFLASALIAFLIPKSYTSTAELMPPDSQSASGMAMMAAMAAKAGSLAGVAGDLLGLKSSGALFIGVLRSHTAEDRIIQQFGLQRIYGTRLLADARIKLDQNTVISEDRKSGIISISVTDRSPQRAADIANAYVDQLNALISQLSTSSAHRERVFLEDRLKVAKLDLDNATNALAQFSSKNNTLDIQTEGRAMLDAAGTLAGQLVAAESELEGLRQIYTDNNPRVKSLSARVNELRRQLEKLGGTQEASAPGTPPSAAASRAARSSAEPSAEPPALASGKIGAMPFPTIRNLPLLGAKYSDYYRQAKMQETVFELLTEQYELAKVEEAKETPSVKVLDPAQLPERKSSPSRLLIIFLGTFLVATACIVGILGQSSWRQADAGDPRKILAQEIAATVRARLPWTANGNTAAHAENGASRLRTIWTRIRRGNGTDGSRQ